MSKLQAPIGVFDSGVGGISTLRTLTRVLPQEDFIFYGDSANAPYGEKSSAEVCVLASQVMVQLKAHTVKAVVIACNTATSAAKQQLIAANPDMPILGIEPALKQAFDAGKQHILVMATPLTISLPKYKAQVARFEERTHVYSLPCPGLADRIELGHDGIEQIQELVDQLMAPVLNDPIDAIVLGCTHYPFIADMIQAKYDHPVTIYTGYEGLANNLAAQLKQRGLLRTENADQHIDFLSSRNTPDELALYQHLYDYGITQ